jgi:cardiolipin synthase
MFSINTNFYFSTKENMSSAGKVKPGYSSGNKTSLIRGGNDYFNLINKLIQESVKSIQLQVYILEADETGNTVIRNLIKAAEKGVQVQFFIGWLCLWKPSFNSHQ